MVSQFEFINVLVLFKVNLKRQPK